MSRYEPGDITIDSYGMCRIYVQTYGEKIQYLFFNKGTNSVFFQHNAIPNAALKHNAEKVVLTVSKLAELLSE